MYIVPEAISFRNPLGTCDFIEDLHKVLVDETDDNYRFLKHVR